MATAIIVMIIIAAILVLLIIVAINIKKSPSQGTPHTDSPWIFEAPERRAGRRGEIIATDIIKRVLREGDYLLTNVSISYDGKPAGLHSCQIP